MGISIIPVLVGGLRRKPSYYGLTKLFGALTHNNKVMPFCCGLHPQPGPRSGRTHPLVFYCNDKKSLDLFVRA